MMGKILLILLTGFCLMSKPGFAEENKTGLKSDSLSREDQEIIILMETLNLLEFAENIDLIEDLDILIEEKPND